MSDSPSNSSSATSFAPRASTRAPEMNGSQPTTRISNAAARAAIAPPIRPSPTTPRVLPASSVPTNALRSQRPARVDATASGMRRTSASSNANVNSVAAIVFAPGVLRTTIPASVAAATSIASTPTPARATTARCGPAASNSRSTRVSERTIKPSARASASHNSSRDFPTHETISMPCSRSTASPVSEKGSATTTRAERRFTCTGLTSR